MDSKNLMQEYEQYTLQDLVLIRDTQQDCHTPMELAMIEELIQRKQDQRSLSRPAQLTLIPMSFILPFCGFSSGRMMRRSSDPQERMAGNLCIAAGVINTLLLISLFVYIGIICAR